jgi:shikimate kinase
MLHIVMHKKPSILALGGGTPIKPENQVSISKGTVIHIKAPKGSVFERIMMQGRPAFFPEGEDAFDAFMRIWDEREPIYKRIADHDIDNHGSIEEGIRQIMTCLQGEVAL